MDERRIPDTVNQPIPAAPCRDCPFWQASQNAVNPLQEEGRQDGSDSHPGGNRQDGSHQQPAGYWPAGYYQRQNDCWQSEYGQPYTYRQGQDCRPVLYGMEPRRRQHGTTFWLLLSLGGGFLLYFLLLAGIIFIKTGSDRGNPAERFPETHQEEQEEDDFWGKQDEQRGSGSKEEEPEEYSQDTEGIYGTTPGADYYSGLTDSINTTTDYSIRWEEYSYSDPDTAAEVYVVYPQLDGGDIPNQEVLNENLEAYAMSVVEFYQEYYLQNVVEGDYLDAVAAVYVTYNDESTVSVVVSESLQMPGAVHNYLCCLNLDLVNGKLFWNTELLKVDDAFIEVFRKQAALQNGHGVQGLSDQELYQYLTNEDTLVLYYTPVGLEVGINYIDEETQVVTWITATIKDYHRFVSSIG